ncbi:hypothetical protein B0H34DRAFT_795889 [Crassisporium funariophilum]|nr:hypothetical protein B0H34DRAFT_795889 [Crassisporium funariophilum]
MTSLPKATSLTAHADIDMTIHQATIPELRKHAVDPRRSRRFGTDFGLGRYTAPHNENTKPKSPVASGMSSTAISASEPLTDEPTDSDSDSSLYDCAALDFPEPPTIGSPVIRRIRSSPWYHDDDASSVQFCKEYIWRSCRVPSDHYPRSALVTEQSRTRNRALISGGIDVQRTTLELVGEALVGLDMNRTNVVSPTSILGSGNCDPIQEFNSGDLSSSDSLAWSSCPASELLRWSTSHRGTPILPTQPQGLDLPRHFTPETPSTEDGLNAECLRSRPGTGQGMGLLGRLPRIIRKVASMRSDTQTAKDSALCHWQAGQRPIPKARSFRIVVPGMREEKQGDFGEMINLGQHSQNHSRLSSKADTGSAVLFEGAFPHSSPASSESQVRCRVRRQHMSLPLSGTECLSSNAGQRKGGVEATGHPKLLGAAFSHRAIDFDTTREGIPEHPLFRTHRSFIDITPEKITRHDSLAGGAKRGRVKNLLVRAGNGIIGWGKQLKRKNT